MPKKQFIDRKNAKHFHLVHRSQRDPLIVDDEASQRVFREVVPANLLKDKPQPGSHRGAETRPKTQEEIEANVGKAALYGIYFDDAEYDYTQHLREVGQTPDAVMLSAKTTRTPKERPSGIKFVDDDKPLPYSQPNDIVMPPEVMASEKEMQVGMLAQEAMPQGLQPDMDPRLREVLEALEDDAYVEEGLEEDFFAELNAESEPYEPEQDYDEGWDSEGEEGYADDQDESWEDAFRRFQAAQKRQKQPDDDEKSDLKSQSTGFSMSSSAMFRNAKLTLLDDQFERMEALYEDSENEEEESGAESQDEPGLQDREDFEAILDDFLEKYEVVGKKMVPRLEGDSSAAKLETIRQALLETHISEGGDENEARDSILDSIDVDHRSNRQEEVMPERPLQKRVDWDVQSVLSTYSNLENHPRMIEERGRKPKIVVDPKTGMPMLIENGKKTRIRIRDDKRGEQEEGKEADEDESEQEDNIPKENLGAARPAKETPEEKKARKATIKETRSQRRKEKKNLKEAFKNEKTKQVRLLDAQRGQFGFIPIA